jgi:hypothetical protein
LQLNMIANNILNIIKIIPIIITNVLLIEIPI